MPHRRPASRRGQSGWRVPAALIGGAAVVMLAVLGARGLIVGAPRQTVGGPYALTDSAGHTVTQADFHGRYTLIYFGYTHCADVCPLTLANIATALDRLGPSGAKIVPIFISVDPGRDTPALVHDYTTHFSPRIVGLTGGPAMLQPVLSAFHVAAHAEMADKGMADDMYAVDHTALLYLMDGDNRLVRVMSVETDAKTLTSELRQAVTS